MQRRSKISVLSAVLLMGVLSAAGCSQPEAVIPTKLTDEPTDERAPAVSPDGKSVAFEWLNEAGGSDIWVLDLETNVRRRITWVPDKRNGQPCWSPDGKSIAFQSSRAGGSNVFIVDADKGESEGPERRARALTHGEGKSGMPSWSPDGKTIAFESDRNGRFDIWIVHVDGSGLNVLTRSASHDNQPGYSPDGKLIAFSSDRSAQRDIWIMNADGSLPRRLTKDNAKDSWPQWAPDSEWVVFLREKGDGSRSVCEVYRDGDSERVLLDARADIREVALSPDGAQIFFAANPEGDYNLYSVSYEEPEKRRKP